MNRILKNQLDEAPQVRHFSRFYVPPEAQASLDEEDRAKLRLHNRLVERQRDAAKTRRGTSPLAITTGAVKRAELEEATNLADLSLSEWMRRGPLSAVADQARSSSESGDWGLRSIRACADPSSSV